jgi:hypothetical protein
MVRDDILKGRSATVTFLPDYARKRVLSSFTILCNVNISVVAMLGLVPKLTIFNGFTRKYGIITN